MNLNIYKIERLTDSEYDKYKSAVVIAFSSNDAIAELTQKHGEKYMRTQWYGTLKITKIGIACDDLNVRQIVVES